MTFCLALLLPGANADTLTVVSYNLYRCYHPAKLAKNIEWLKAEKSADVFLLQEVIRSPGPFFLDSLCDSTWRFAFYPTHPKKKQKAFGLGIYTRLPIGTTKGMAFKKAKSLSNYHVKGFLWARLALESGDSLNVVSVHLDAFPALGYFARRKETRSLMGFLSGQTGIFTVLGGDFNCAPWTFPHKQLRKAGYVPAFPKTTKTFRFPPFVPLHYDHLYASESVRILKAEVIKKVVAGSDHRPVLFIVAAGEGTTSQ